MRYALAVSVTLLFQTVNISAICECWVTEQVDEWTDEKSIVLVCSDQETESAIILFDNREVVFYDGTARQQTGSLVSWEYRIGSSEMYRINIFWNRDTQPPNLRSESHFPELFHGVSNGDSIRFRLRPFGAPETGRVNVLRDCYNAKESADLFAPIVEGLAQQ